MTITPKKTQHETAQPLNQDKTLQQEREGSASLSSCHSRNYERNLRQCIVSRESKPKKDLLRLVVDPTGTIAPDYNHKLPGRGLWVCWNNDILQKALNDVSFFRRASKDKTITIPTDLQTRIEKQIDAQIYAKLGLLRRSGQLLWGYETVVAEVKKKKIGAYFTTAQQQTDSRKKIEQIIGDKTPIRILQDQNQVDRIINSENTTHIIAKSGDLCLNLLQHIDNRSIIAG